MSSLLTNKQQKMANKYSKSMAKASEQGELFASDVLNSLSPDTIDESFQLIMNKGHDYEKNKINCIKENYESGIKLNADEIIQLNDIFTVVTRRLEDSNGD